MGRRKRNLMPEPGLKQMNIQVCLANLGKNKSDQVQIKKFIGPPVKMSENVTNKTIMNNGKQGEKRPVEFKFGSGRPLPFEFSDDEDDNESMSIANKSKENETVTSPQKQSKVTILSNEVISPAKNNVSQINEKCSDSITAKQSVNAANKKTSESNETSDNNSAKDKMPATPSKKSTPTLLKKSPNSTNQNNEKSSTANKSVDAANKNKKSSDSDETSDDNSAKDKTPTTPSKNNTKTLPKLSPNKSPKKAMEPFINKKEKKGINPKFLDLMNDLIVTVCQSKHLSKLLDKDDYRILKHVRGTNPNYQFVCFKLYKYKSKWYKLSDFIEMVGLNLSDQDIVSLYDFLRNNDVVETDYKKEDLKVLLDHLNKPDIIKICSSLRIRSPTKSKRVTNKKDQLIDKILKECKTRTTLSVTTITKNTEDLVRREIEKNLGKHVVKIKEDFKKSLRRVYVLATFTNPHLDDMDQYFKTMMYDNILYPEYEVTEYPVFYSQSEFNSYMQARRLQQEMEECITKKVLLKAMGIQIFKELKAIPQDNGDVERYKDTPHLRRFTAERVYVKCLSSISEKILTYFLKDAKEWLEYLMERYPHSSRLGSWYINLIRIHNNLKNYEHAGNLLLAAFRDEMERFSDVDVQALAEKSAFMRNRINQMQRDNLIELLPVPIKEGDFPSNMIDAQAVRGNVSGRKRDYVITDSEGNKTYKSVEDIALDYYCDEAGYTNGVHCEGGIINALFALFFWDIVYEPETVVPGIFLSKIQFYPLDLLTPHFYVHRKESIDQRLKDISENWRDDAVVRFAKQHWRLFGHYRSFCQINQAIENDVFLETLVSCIGRKVLAMILERLVKDVRLYRSGLPDLFVWNKKEQKAKFVEVKGENDTLSIKQKLWLKYLGSVGADVEVCYVHSIGSKKKLQKKEKTEKTKTPKKNSTTPRKKAKPKKKVDTQNTDDSPKKEVTSNKKPSEEKEKNAAQHQSDDSAPTTPLKKQKPDAKIRGNVCDPDPSTSSSSPPPSSFSSCTTGKPPSPERPSDYDSDFEISSPSTSPKKKQKLNSKETSKNGNDDSVYDPGPSTSNFDSQANKRNHAENVDDVGSPIKKKKSLFKRLEYY